MAEFRLKDNGIFYSRWYFTLLLIAGASVLIGYIFAWGMKLDMNLHSVFLRSFFSTVTIWAGCMAIVTLCWKRFPWQEMPFIHLLVEVGLILLFLTAFVFFQYVYDNFLDCKTVHVDGGSSEVAITVLITFLITSIHEAVFFYRQWKLNFSKSLSLERDNIEARYKMLKAQVNPHFLFNSLNSLMTLIEDNPEAEEYVQKLSEFLRYVLISNERGLVPLYEELMCLDKYIYLQKIRFGSNLQITQQIDQATTGLFIPPLVLQMLFDNCVKHNVVASQHPLYINICTHGNSVCITNNLQPRTQYESTGQGLRNIEGRYRLLTMQPVKVMQSDTEFSVSIPLILPDKL